MNFYAFSAIINAVASLVLGALVFSKGRREKVNISFAVFAFFVFLWSFGYYFWQVADNASSALFWSRFFMASAVFIPIVYFRFILVLLGLVNSGKNKILKLGYFLFSIFLFFNFTPLFVNRIELIPPFGYWPRPGPIFHIFLVIWFIYVIYANYLLYIAYKKAKGKGVLRSQLGYVMFGMIIGYLGGSTNYFLWYKIPIPPIGNILVVLFVILTAYAIIKHHLMNIRVIATELFTLAIILTLFINIFTAPTNNLKLLQAVILAAVSFFGYLLIKSVLREVKQREEIQRLAVSLEEANKRLVKLDREKSDFLSIATHQLRAPMASVKGYISMLLEGTYGILSDIAKDTLRKIYTSNERLIKLIDDLLDISRIERGKMEYDFKIQPLEKLVSDVISELKPVADRKNMRIVWQEPAGLAQAVFDAAKMRQVVLNLIDNAIKYSQPGGEIDVRVENADGRVRLSVKDTGAGISNEKMKHLFERYSRGEGAKAYAEGMGLGLYVAKIIIQDHKGRIWAESEGEDRGSTFFVEVPVG